MTTETIDVTYEDILEMETTKNFDGWNVYYENIRQQLGARTESFDEIFKYLINLEHAPVIIETGTYREENNYTGDGCSTLLFDKFVDCFGGDLYSVDIDPKACELARSSVVNAEIVESDSVEFLGSLWGPCDLLYLDSYNIQNWMDDWAPAAHHLKELFAAKNIIKTGTLIVVDDNIIHQGKRMGKGRLIYELMDALGIDPLFDLYQVGWVWEEIP
jgi:predicted O-methyltransferase YrrM